MIGINRITFFNAIIIAIFIIFITHYSVHPLYYVDIHNIILYIIKSSNQLTRKYDTHDDFSYI